MTKLLSITAHPDAAVACDMTDAEDTLAARIAEYRRLFNMPCSAASPLTPLPPSGSPPPGSARMAAGPGPSRGRLLPFPLLGIELDETVDGEQIVWTTSGGVGASEMAVLDEFLTGPVRPEGDSTSIARQLTDGGGVTVIVPAEHR